MNKFSCYDLCKLIITVYCVSVNAEVVTDGSLNGIATELSGPEYTITSDLGQQRGNNLFHSFSRFNLVSGEQATFSTGNGIQTIIARVTGGDISSIDGSINSESASLWMINPAGWVFGANAKINVKGAFHVSTADSVRFDENSHFFADPDGQSILSISKPVGVSFLKPQQARITLDHTILELTEKSSLSMTAAEVSIKDANIQSPDGQVLIGAATSTGDWVINEQGLYTENIAELGRVDIINETFKPGISDQAINISYENNTIVNNERQTVAQIQIIAGDALLQNTTLSALTFSDQQGGEINLQVTGNLDLVKTAVNSEAIQGSGDAGDISITAANLTMTDESTISASAQARSEGGAGMIDINIDKTLSMSGNNTEISTATHGAKAAGDITINAEAMDMSNTAVVRASTTGAGGAGNINISSRNEIIMNGGATIDSSARVLKGTFSKGGQGGEINITTHKLNLDGVDTLITSSSFGNGRQGGDIEIFTTQLNLSDQAEIRAKSESQANAGNITISNSHQMHVDNAKVTTETKGGNGGEITLQSQDLILTNAQLTTSVEGSKGNGGNISIDSEILVMNTGFIQANTLAIGGNGGKVLVNAEQFIASGSHVEVGGLKQRPFMADSGLNVIQAAAPNGVSGEARVINVELNIAGELKPIQSGFSTQQTIVNLRVKSSQI